MQMMNRILNLESCIVSHVQTNYCWMLFPLKMGSELTAFELHIMSPQAVLCLL